MKKVAPLLLALGMFVASSSCTKIESSTAALTYSGDIVGHVILYDQYGSKVTNGLSSVVVTVDGSTATNPDTTGYYIFLNATTGDYTLSASDSGYAATFINSFQFLGDTLNKDIKMSAIPNFAPISETVYTSVSTPGDSIVINFNADTRARNAILFINGTSPAGNVPASYQLVYVKAIPANKTSIFITIPSSDLSNVGIVSGSTMYGAAYGYVVGDASVYEDLTTGKNVYNAVSAAPVVFSTTAP